jgi:nitrous oxide reductase accessory protein NosL
LRIKEKEMLARQRNALFRILGMPIIASALFLFTPVLSAADILRLPNGSEVDLAAKCPVCGMAVGGTDRQGASVTFKDGRVAGFHGVAAAVFKDGRVVGFEGARCLFIYNSVPQNYNVDVKNISRQFVTDFTSKKIIDLSKAFLVLGSNVKGPMGYDLIPFSSKEETAKFAAENDGKWIVQLHEVGRNIQDQQGIGKPDTKDQETPSIIPTSRPRSFEPPRSHGRPGC